MDVPLGFLLSTLGLPPPQTRCAFYHANTLTLPKMEISEARLGKMDPVKAYQSNLLQPYLKEENTSQTYQRSLLCRVHTRR